MNGRSQEAASALSPTDAVARAPRRAPVVRGAPRVGRARAFWSHPWATQYHRLFAALALLNAAVLAWGLAHAGWASDPLDVPLALLGRLALANFALAILIRQQRVVNALFWLASRVPTSAPLWLRWQCAKVFHFGGLHTAGASCGTGWFALLLAAQAWHASAGGTQVSGLTLALGAAMLPLLLAMIVTALPALRSANHNRFELVHRFGGWTLLALFWLHALATQADLAHDSGGLLNTPEFWVLCALTLSVASPWWRLRRVPVEVVKPSSHAVVLRFKHGPKPFPGSSTSLSLSPLREWHGFANIPAPGEDGFRIIVSRAGDWTGALIDQPPTHLWVKGITTAGVAYVESFFKRVVYVATGSGIGPVLPHLLYGRLPIHLIWATRSPAKTYGQPVVDEILRAVPDAHIWDTDTHGKPDLAALALDAVAAFGAEAVIVIANRKLTESVIRAVERRGIPGYGAIWDS
jgi:NAD(P)H-flavin reductase